MTEDSTIIVHPDNEHDSLYDREFARTQLPFYSHYTTPDPSSLIKYKKLDYYVLYIAPVNSSSVSRDVLNQLYKNSINKRHNSVKDWLDMHFHYDSTFGYSSKASYIDAGFDLFMPDSLLVPLKSFSNILKLGIKCAMYHYSAEGGLKTFCYGGEQIQESFATFTPCAFYLYPRSSMGAKTPLRLSNSVGIIDSGYRGELGAIVDNVMDVSYEINKGDRLVQICPPNLEYPMKVYIVDDISLLGYTDRGTGGFGSTGK